MGKNLIPIIARELGVEIGEEFRIKQSSHTNFRFSETRLECKATFKDGYIATDGVTLLELIEGDLDVIKLPFEPKYGEKYWAVGAWWQVDWYEWRESPLDYMHKSFDYVFRTEEEAIKARPKIYKRLTGKEWGEK